ncbi:CoA transferase, partial [Rhodococcus sp. CX]|nr:CoA transferase [Rhodococcus sp. CX]
LGTVQVLGLPTHVDGRAVGPATRPPILGEHTDEILAEIGFTADQIDNFRQEGAV